MADDKRLTEEKSGKTEKAPQVGATPRAAALAGLGRAGGIEQVRDILFGAIHRDLEQKIARADAHAAARIHDLELEHRRRTEVLEAHLKKETEALAARVDRQLAEINDTLRNLSREQREASQQSERRSAKAEEASAAGLRDLRQQLLEQAKSFLDELQGLRREMLATIQRELGLEEGEPLEERGEADRGARH